MRGLGAAIISGVLALAGFSSIASAQTLPVTPQKLALAQQIVSAEKLDRTMVFAMNVVAQPIIQQINAGQGSPELKSYTVNLFKSEIGVMQQKFLPLMAEVYARTFDDRQLADILAFYSSPTGQLLVDKQPELGREAQLVINPLIPPMQREVVEKLFNHICETEKCSPAQRQKLSAVKEQLLQKFAPTGAPVEMPAQ